ncbi:MAG: GNAT family protein [Albidovulum sp.]|nr:GNAT family protein [Albidovulum sp.]MDE0532864.1 GNAT family protein [Albidovulum sp.]
MLNFFKRPVIYTDRIRLRLPERGDFTSWSKLRADSEDFLRPWEPSWTPYHLSRGAFFSRVYWAHKSHRKGTAMPLLLIRKDDDAILGGITLDNIRRGPAQSGSLGYWIGKRFARNGYMKEAVPALVHHAFTILDLSRIEAACLPDNVASRGLLEKTGFKYEGVAQCYLEIEGRWSHHVLYANLRPDRRGLAVKG